MTALVAAIGLEGALMIARRYAQGTQTLQDDAIIQALGFGAVAFGIANPAGAARAGVGIVKGVSSGARRLSTLADDAIELAAKRKRKPSGYNRDFAKELKAVRAKNTKKDGSLRKGVTNADLLKKAHASTKRKTRQFVEIPQ